MNFIFQKNRRAKVLGRKDLIWVQHSYNKRKFANTCNFLSELSPCWTVLSESSLPDIRKQNWIFFNFLIEQAFVLFINKIFTSILEI